MDDRYRVTLESKLFEALMLWQDEDQDILYGFVTALRRDGFDVISGRFIKPMPGLFVEYIEPGETPEMVWACVFLDLTGRALRLRVDCKAVGILLSEA